MKKKYVEREKGKAKYKINNMEVIVNG
jgi:hypothetical protein